MIEDIKYITDFFNIETEIISYSDYNSYKTKILRSIPCFNWVCDNWRKHEVSIKLLDLVIEYYDNRRY